MQQQQQQQQLQVLGAIEFYFMMTGLAPLLPMPCWMIMSSVNTTMTENWNMNISSRVTNAISVQGVATLPLMWANCWDFGSAFLLLIWTNYYRTNYYLQSKSWSADDIKYWGNDKTPATRILQQQHSNSSNKNNNFLEQLNFISRWLGWHLCSHCHAEWLSSVNTMTENWKMNISYRVTNAISFREWRPCPSCEPINCWDFVCAFLLLIWTNYLEVQMMTSNIEAMTKRQQQEYYGNNSISSNKSNNNFLEQLNFIS